MVELFLQCCERFLANDAELIRRLHEHGFEIADNGWNFTLPELHRFLSLMVEGGAPSYRNFRQQLFNNPINTHLAEQGAAIVIVANRHKVDLSTYRVQRRVGND